MCFMPVITRWRPPLQAAPHREEGESSVVLDQQLSYWAPYRAVDDSYLRAGAQGERWRGLGWLCCFGP